ncbi:MAG: flavodoxin family protein [Candidatus Methanoperedens sp.]|nr:flavodoxin family protein [Candidatus Methanoperedens sp.]
MKVIAINGSARKQGNTAILIKYVLNELEKAGIETELIELSGEKIRGCTACYKCLDKKDGHRRGGAIHGFDSINHFFHISQMIVPGASYWNMGLGRQIGDVRTDEEGIRTMKNLGENMAWLMKKIVVDE